MGRIVRHLLGISKREISLSRRGFHPDDSPAVQRLELAGAHFVDGYNAALEYPPAGMAGRIDQQTASLRGFWVEGAAMGFALLDRLSPFRKDRLAEWIAVAGGRYIHLIHVGAGWVLGRLPLNPMKYPARFDPLLRWLVLDGYGFHEAFFHQARCYERGGPPSRLEGYARRAFDQGLGRALWFIECADAERIIARIAGLPAGRRADLWSGVGLACAYAGEAANAPRLVEASGEHAPHFAQGVAFACKAHALTGDIPPHAETASREVWNVSAEAAAAVCDECQRDLPTGCVEPAFETWRARVRQAFQAQMWRFRKVDANGQGSRPAP